MIIVLEGIDGSGKSTLAKKLYCYFNDKDYASKLVLSRSFHDYENENGLDLFSKASVLKTSKKLKPLSSCLWHAADFSYRLESEILSEPSDTIFIMDRYIYTPMVRDSIRGVDLNYVKELYSFAPTPDKVFLLNITPNKALQRVIGRGGEPGYYESGSDFKNGATINDNFLVYQEECKRMYKNIIPSKLIVSIDAEMTEDLVFNFVIKAIENDVNTNKKINKD